MQSCIKCNIYIIPCATLLMLKYFMLQMILVNVINCHAKMPLQHFLLHPLLTVLIPKFHFHCPLIWKDR